MKSRLLFTTAVALFGAAVRADEKPGAVPAELSWVPPNCAAFVHVRFADLWDSSAGKTVREAIAKADPRAIAAIEQETGIRLAQVESLTLVIPQPPSKRQLGLALRITTTEPFDAKRVLAALHIEHEGEPSPGQKLFVAREERALVHLTGPKDLTLIFDREGALGLLGKLLERPTTGGLSPALAAAGQKHTFVAGIDVSQFRHLPAEDLPPALRPLLDARHAVLAGDLKADSAELALNLSFSRSGHAEDGARALAGLKEEALKALDQAAREFSADKEAAPQAKIIGLVADALKAVKIETKDAQVAAAVSLKTEEPLAILAGEGIAALKLSAARMQSQNNLKQIGLALHNYHDVHGALPPAAICDKNGKPLLSWRVAILPFIEQDQLYKQFHLDEPWDSEHNKALLQFMPKTYALPADKAKHDPPATYYRVFADNGAMFDLKRGVTFAQVTDGLSNTLMVVEAADAVPWSKPDELDYDPQKAPKLGFHFGDRANVLLGDGSVRAIRKTLPERTLHLLIQRSDGQPVVID
jgi:hypothetical protein